MFIIIIFAGYSSPYLVCYAENSTFVFNVVTAEWLQTMCLKRVRNCSTLESVCKPSSFWARTGFKIWSVRAWFCNLNQRFTCMMGKMHWSDFRGTLYCCHSCFRPNRCARMGHCVFSVLLIRNTSSTWRTSKQVQFAASKIHGGGIVVCVWGGGALVPHAYRICLHIHTSVNSGSINC